MATDSEILTEIELAIADILSNGQEVTIDGDVYSKANVSTLFKQRDRFVQKTAASSDTFFSRMKTIVPGRS